MVQPELESHQAQISWLIEWVFVYFQVQAVFVRIERRVVRDPVTAYPGLRLVPARRVQACPAQAVGQGPVLEPGNNGWVRELTRSQERHHPRSSSNNIAAHQLVSIGVGEKKFELMVSKVLLFPFLWCQSCKLFSSGDEDKKRRTENVENHLPFLFLFSSLMMVFWLKAITVGSFYSVPSLSLHPVRFVGGKTVIYFQVKAIWFNRPVDFHNWKGDVIA